MSDPCAKCSGTDFTPGGKCRACQKATNEKYRAQARKGKPAKAAKATKAKKAKKPKKAAPAAAASAIALEIEQGYGIKASIDDAYLIIAQHDGESGNDDKICLSRSEFRQLVSKFGEWAA